MIYSLKWAHSDFHLSFFQIGAWWDFTVLTKLIKNFKTLYSFGGHCLKLETFIWILNHITRFIAWSLFTLKASCLVIWPISIWSFTCWCQFIDLLKFETRPSSLLNFRMANWALYLLTPKTYHFNWNRHDYHLLIRKGAQPTREFMLPKNNGVSSSTP